MEKPYKPTFRVSKSIYYKGVFYGILIVNIDMSELEKFIKSFSNFDISLIDKKGNYLLSSDDKKEWSRYLDKQYTFKKTYLSEIPNTTENKLHIHSMENIFQNVDEIKIILQVKNQFVEKLSNENYVYIYSVSLIIFISAIVIGLGKSDKI